MRRKGRWLRVFNILSAAVLGVTVVNSEDAAAQTYPSRPITMIVPYPAGGPTDTLARIWPSPCGRHSANPSSLTTWRAPPAASVSAASRVLHPMATRSVSARPTHVINGAVLALPYDLRSDFEPIALIANNPLLIVAKKAMPAQNLKDFIAWLKANPDKASEGPAASAAIHVAGVFFQRKPARAFNSCLIAARARRCRTWWPARSISCSICAPMRCRRCEPAASRPMRSRPKPAAVGARDPDGGRSRMCRAPYVALARTVGTKGTPKDRRRQAQRRTRRGAGRSGGAQAASRTSGRRFRRASSRRQRRSPPSTRPRSRNGGRS